MADFRKWLLAFAVVTLLLGMGIPAQAAPANGVPGGTACVVAGATPLVRAEGYTELVGDITMSCTGGTPTAAATPIPQYDITVGLNTNITSRIYTPVTTGGNSYTPTEAVLLFDNAGITGGIAVSPCGQVTGCTLNGNGGTTEPYATDNAYTGVLQGAGVVPVAGGAISGTNGIAFLGVPIDAPSTGLARSLRITNVRANAAGLYGSTSNLGAIYIVAYVSITGISAGAPTISVTISQPDVGYVIHGLASSVTPAAFSQCTSNSIVSGTGPFGITIAENFAYAFKTRYNNGSGQYSSESGFILGTGAQSNGPNTAGTTSPGLANSGTRFIITLSNIQNGLNVAFPDQVISGTLTLTLVSGADATGAGGSLSTGGTTGTTTVAGSYTNSVTGGTSSFVVYEVTAANAAQEESITIPPAVTYTSSVGNNVPYVTPPAVTDLLTPNSGNSQVTVAFAPTAPTTISLPTGSNAGLAWNLPQGGTGVTSDLDYQWIPRFTYNPKPVNGLLITACTCNLLYPYVTASTGYDTGIEITNTSADPFGTIGQTGSVVFYFYGNSTNTSTKTPTAFQVPETTATSALVVPPGCTLAFEMTQASQAPGATLLGCDTTLTGTGGAEAGNYTINATSSTTPLAGFTGYAIATASFQYCHGLAYILGSGSSFGATYLAIQLDHPGLYRTLQTGENLGH